MINTTYCSYTYTIYSQTSQLHLNAFLLGIQTVIHGNPIKLDTEYAEKSCFYKRPLP